MAVYDINGVIPNSIYDVDGVNSDYAYNIDGTEIWNVANTFKVMSFNVGSWGGYGKYVPNAETDYYMNLYETIFRNNDASIVGIQEYYQKVGTESTLTLLDEFYPSIYAVNRIANPSKAGRAITSKYTLSNTAEINFDTQLTTEIRSFLTSTVNIAGKIVYFLDAHLALTVEEIEAQINELLQYVSDKEYWILTGDFNTHIAPEGSEGYNRLVKQFIDAGYNAANGGDYGFFSTFYGDNGWRCLDNIFTSANISIENVYTDQTKVDATLTYGIDHIPLIAELTIH